MTSQQVTDIVQSKGADGTPLSSDAATPRSPAITQQVHTEQGAQPEACASLAPTEAPPNPRLEGLAAKKANLEATLASLQVQKSALVAEANLPSGLAMPEDWSQDERAKSALTTANGVIKEHIALLHNYNEIKDIGQGLMGLVADKRGVRIATVMEEYGMGEKD